MPVKSRYVAEAIYRIGAFNIKHSQSPAGLHVAGAADIAPD